MKAYCLILTFFLSLYTWTPTKGTAHGLYTPEYHHGNVRNIPEKANKSKNISSEPDAGIQPLKAAASEIIPWEHEDVYGNVWDTSPYKAYLYEDIEFRLMFPNGFDSTANDGKKYPLILHIAGRGETGTDNELQLRHAGPGHKQAIEEDRFPGFALFPQVQSTNGFATYKDLKRYTEIIELLIQNNKVDPNRIYVHGLSAGGDATWRLIRDYPHLFAAALPMSWSHNKYVQSDSLIKRYIHIPIWISQGGKDDYPPATQTNDIVTTIRNTGGKVRYKYLPNAGHGTWTAMYTATHFFEFMLSHSKLSIHVYHEQTSFCPGEAINTTLGISPGFDEYEWQKDEQAFASGNEVNEISVTEPGSYRVRFRRGAAWTEWSEPVVIDQNREVLPTPEISTNGQSRNLVTALDGSTSVTLSAPEGYEQYVWKKNDAEISGDLTNSLLVDEPGSYTLTIAEPAESPFDENGVPKRFRPEPPRCESAVSAPIVVTVQDNAGTPASPTNFSVDTKTPFSLQIRWDDVADNERGYEIYRAEQSGGPYSLVTITSANITSYTDDNLADQTTYFYQVRAVNNQGGSSYTAEKSSTTGTDTTAPDAPEDFTITPLSTSAFELTWTDKAFNEKGYKIFRSLSENGSFTLIHTTDKNITGFTDEDLTGNTTYFYKILAFNNNGESDTISSAGISTLNGFPVISGLGPQTVKTGDTVTLVLNATDPENDPVSWKTVSALSFTSFSDNGDDTGTLKIMPASAHEGFHANMKIVANDGNGGSDSVSLLLTVINNDFKEVVHINFGNHNAAGNPWNNTTASPAPGQSYEALLDATDGETTPIQMKVLTGWDAEIVNGATTQNNSGVFPDSVLAKGWQTSDSAALELTGLDPDLLYNFTFLASKAGFDDGETAFYINGEKVTLDASRNTDNTVSLNGIAPDAQGNVTISITKSGSSAKGYLNALVIASYENAVPIHPTGLQAIPVSRTDIKLQWNDQAGNEAGYEIYRSIGMDGEFSLLTATAPNVNTFTDGELTNNTIYQYKVRAFNDLGTSEYTDVVSASTLNQKVLVNFNGATHVTAPAPWNNTARTPTEGAVIADLIDDQSDTTNMALTIKKWGTGFDNKLGLTTGDDSGVYPDEVLETYYFLEPYDEPVQFTFSGLDPHLSYNFTFFGDGGSGEVSDDLFMPGSDLRTQFIIGQDTVILNALDNTSKTVQIKNVTPDEKNEITVSIMAYEGPTIETSAIFGIFNSIVMEGFYAEEILTNSAPAIASVEEQLFEEGDTVSLQLEARDTDDDPVAFSAENLPPGLEIDPATGLISGVIGNGAAENSPYAVKVTVNDSLPINNLGEMTFSMKITASQQPVVCTTPSDLSATPKIIGDTAGVLLTWKGDTAALQYKVRYRKLNAATWEELQTPNGNAQLTIENLAFDTNYEWSVQSLCAENVMSDTSAVQTFTTPVKPTEVCDAPQNLSAEIVSVEDMPNEAVISWDVVAGAVSYEVEYSIDSINWNALTTTESTVTLTELSKNADYHVHVRSVCTEDGTTVSNNVYTTFNAGTWGPSACDAPENVLATIVNSNGEANTVVINWNIFSTAIRYEVAYSTDSVEWTALTTTETSVTLNDLLQDTDYHVAVHSVCSEDGSVVSDDAYTTFNIASSAEVCEIAENLEVVTQTPKDSTLDITLAWQGPEGAAFYYLLYAEKEASKWEKMKVTNDTTLLENLLPETTYRWAVITGCSEDETLVSDTSTIAEFTTDPVDVVSDIDDDLVAVTFNVYPVPSQGNFTVELKPEYATTVQLFVYDVLGALIYQSEDNTHEFKKQVHLSAPRPGVYFVKLIVGEEVYSKRVLIQ